MLFKKQKSIKPSTEFERKFNELVAKQRRKDKIHFILRIIIYPILFIVVNGSFIIIAKYFGLIHLIKQHEGIISQIKHFVFTALYIAYVYFFALICDKLSNKFKIPWLFRGK